MASVINKFKICDKITEDLQQKIKYFYVFKDWRKHNILFVTFDDMVYGLGSNMWGQLGLGLL